MELSESYKQMCLSNLIKRPSFIFEMCAHCGTFHSRYNAEGNLEPATCKKCGRAFAGTKPVVLFWNKEK